MSSKALSVFRAHLWGQDRQPTWSVDARTATGLVLCIALLSLVGWLYLTQASQIATTSIRMRETVDDIEQLERENALLRFQIAQLEAIPRIEARAKQLGLGSMYNQTTYLTVPESLGEIGPAPVRAQFASAGAASRAPIAEPASHFAMPSLPEIWDEVKAQLASWTGG